MNTQDHNKPVAWMLIDDTGMKWVSVLRESSAYDIPLYTQPSDAAAQIADWKKTVMASLEMCRERDEQIAKLEARINELDGQLCYINCPNCGELAGQNESIINKKLAAAEKDAARYRWLRQQESWIPPKEQLPAWYQGPVKWIGGPYSENEIDDMVDYAMKLSPGDTAEGE